MKVISLIDNLSCSPIPSADARDALSAFCADKLCGVEHGLSLYIELECGARILFDTGQGSLFAENAAAMGVDLSSVDLAVISHGHYDHAGGLAKFLEINKKAPVYISRSAFGGHFSVKEYGLKPIGVPVLESSDRLMFCGEVEHLPYGITLFSNPPVGFPEPPGNSRLLGPDGQTPDDFSHEQSMIITEPAPASVSHHSQLSSQGDAPMRSRSVLFGGCAHRGIANILTRAEQLVSGPQAFASDSGTLSPITVVFSGMHLASLFAPPIALSSSSSISVHLNSGVPDPDIYVCSLAASLLAHPDVQYWTMHCTGEEGSRRLSELMGDRLRYLPCGHSVTLR